MEDDLRRFMFDRGISPETIKLMQEDKIDVAVIAAMDDADLSKYFVIGDRIAVKEFCKRKCRNQLRHNSGDRKEALLSKLRAKLDARKRSFDTESGNVISDSECEFEDEKVHDAKKTPWQSLVGNSNAAKRMRKVEIGWLHGDTSVTVKQVRTRNGGGTRILSVANTSTKCDLLAIAKSLFFINGMCKYGEESEFTFDICDFKQSVVGQSVTVAELQEQSKMSTGRLRVYLCTRRRPSATVSVPADMSPALSDKDDIPELLPNDDLPVVCSSGATESTGNTASSFDNSIQQDSSNSTFVDLGTPTIALRVSHDQVPLFVNHEQCQQSSSLYQYSCAAPHQHSQQELETTSSVLLSSVQQQEEAEVLLSESDDGLQTAIAASLQDSTSDKADDVVLSVSSEVNFEKILTNLAMSIDKEALKNKVNVTRDDVLDGGIRAFSRPAFNPLAPLNVVYVGEESQDTGGPSREFLRQALRSIQNMCIFDGPPDQRSIRLDYTALSTGLYKIVGKMVAYSIVHGGPLPTFCDEKLYSLLCGTPAFDIKADLSDVHDDTLRQHLMQILSSKTTDEYATAIMPVQDLIDSAGCVSLTRTVQNNNNLVNSLCHFQLVGRNVIAIEQFAEGLKVLGVLDAIQKHPAQMKNAFVFRTTLLLASDVEELFTIHWSNCDKGSNKKRMEEKTIGYFRDFLQDLEEEQRVIFVTGLDSVPPLGFHPPPFVYFGHPVELKGDVTVNFPVASTCSNSLRLPVVTTYTEFASNMMSAIQMATTFTLA